MSNTDTKADYWLSAWPGSEAALLLAMCNVLIRENLYQRDFVRRCVNWQEYLREEYADKSQTFESFIEILKDNYREFMPEFAEKESGVPAATASRLGPGQEQE